MKVGVWESSMSEPRDGGLCLWGLERLGRSEGVGSDHDEVWATGLLWRS